jgi:hypothetical protein
MTIFAAKKLFAQKNQDEKIAQNTNEGKIK